MRIWCSASSSSSNPIIPTHCIWSDCFRIRPVAARGPRRLFGGRSRSIRANVADYLQQPWADCRRPGRIGRRNRRAPKCDSAPSRFRTGPQQPRLALLRKAQVGPKTVRHLPAGQHGLIDPNYAEAESNPGQRCKETGELDRGGIERVTIAPASLYARRSEDRQQSGLPPPLPSAIWPGRDRRGPPRMEQAPCPAARSTRQSDRTRMTVLRTVAASESATSRPIFRQHAVGRFIAPIAGKPRPRSIRSALLLRCRVAGWDDSTAASLR